MIQWYDQAELMSRRDLAENADKRALAIMRATGWLGFDGLDRAARMTPDQQRDLIRWNRLGRRREQTACD